MDQRSFAALIIRVTGMIVIIQAATLGLKTVAAYLATMQQPGADVTTLAISIVLTVMIPLAIGFILVNFPRSVANRLVSVEETKANPDDTQTLQRVAFSVIGLWLAMYAVVDFAYYYGKVRLYAQFVGETSSFDHAPPLLPDDFGGLVPAGMQLVLGIALLFGNRGLVGVINRPRG